MVLELGNKNCGYLEIIVGPMTSGKSTELIQRTLRYQSIGFKVLAVNWSDDVRYGINKIINHNGNYIPAVYTKNLLELYNNINFDNSEVIVINEAQFFDTLYEFVKKCVNEFNKKVILSGLDGDYKKEPFNGGQILQLISEADKVTKINALCYYCSNGTVAPFTYRISDNKEQVSIGGIDEYKPVCRFHFKELMANREIKKDKNGS